MKLLNIPHVEIRRTNTLRCEDADMIANGPEAVLPILREILSGREQESFVVLILNVRNRVIAWREVARGSAKSVDVPVRELFRTALMCDAVSLILSHNHPSGDPTPSLQDTILTAKLAEAGELIGCSVVDHIIIGDGDRYYSFASQGRIAMRIVSPMNGERQGPELD